MILRPMLAAWWLSLAGSLLASEPALVVIVHDANTEQPIPRFRAIAGVPSFATPEQFAERTLQEAANYQPHTIQEGVDGRMEWPRKSAYERMVLRIEADGYKPFRTGWIDQGDGPRLVSVSLEPDAGVDGQVLQPDGRPADGAVLAVVLPQRDATLDGAAIRGASGPLPQAAADRWRRPTIARADSEGRFHLYTETDPASAILVAHESGVYELPASEFYKRPQITLERWGRIEGEAVWQDKPGANEPIAVSAYRDEYGYPGMIGQFIRVQADDQGKFAVEHLLPGRIQVGRPEFVGLYQHLTVLPGETANVRVGGEGRTARGRLTGRDSWEGITIRFRPVAPSPSFGGADLLWQKYNQFRTSPVGPLYFRGGVRPNSEGSFEIARIMPGRYQLFVSSPDADRFVGAMNLEIEPEQPGEALEAVELGEIAVRPPRN